MECFLIVLETSFVLQLFFLKAQITIFTSWKIGTREIRKKPGSWSVGRSQSWLLCNMRQTREWLFVGVVCATCTSRYNVALHWTLPQHLLSHPICFHWSQVKKENFSTLLRHEFEYKVDKCTTNCCHHSDRVPQENSKSIKFWELCPLLCFLICQPNTNKHS